MGDLFAPDARMHRLPGTPATTGREAIRQAYRQIFAALSRAEVHPAHTYIYGNGGAVLYRGVFTGTTGAAFPVEGIDVFEIDADGRIEAIRFYWDPAPFAALLRG